MASLEFGYLTVKSQGSKCPNIGDLCTLKPYYLGIWTLRVIPLKMIAKLQVQIGFPLESLSDAWSYFGPYVWNRQSPISRRPSLQVKPATPPKPKPQHPTLRYTWGRTEGGQLGITEDEIQSHIEALSLGDTCALSWV